MNSLVVYGSRYGNTRRIAEAIVAQLVKHGDARLLPAEEVTSAAVEQADLVVVGGPTEGHRMSVPLGELFDRLGEGALEGMAAAAFDTRLRWPLLLSGSAAFGIAKRLERAGADYVVQPVSFFVGGKPTALEAGEIERAAVWAASLASRVESKRSVLTAC